MYRSWTISKEKMFRDQQSVVPWHSHKLVTKLLKIKLQENLDLRQPIFTSLKSHIWYVKDLYTESKIWSSKLCEWICKLRSFLNQDFVILSSTLCVQWNFYLLKNIYPCFVFSHSYITKEKKAELRLLSDPLLNSWWWKCPLFLQSGNSNLCAKIFFSSLFFLQYSTEPDKKHSFSSFTQFQWIQTTGQIISE